MKVFKVKGDDGFTRISHKKEDLPIDEDWVKRVSTHIKDGERV